MSACMRSGDGKYKLEVCENVLQKDEWDKLTYSVDYEAIYHCIKLFMNMIRKMDIEAIDEIESEGWIKETENERSSKNKYPICDIHNVLLTCFGCQICNSTNFIMK